ncbi:MAG TPA: phosphoglucosamine mutase, partial [Acidimicrobiales bacterium]
MLKFGTDGVRGVANAELTPELALVLGRAAARVLGGDRFAIGRDTRLSGPMLEAALCAGLVSEGVDVELLGVAPTPEVAWWSVTADAPAAVVSASHNPFPDNGIKLFAAGGRKLPDEVEERLERELRVLLGDAASPRDAPTGAGLGAVRTDAASVHSGYRTAVSASLAGRDLAGLRAVVDCAHGAASVVAPAVLSDLGVDVEVIHADPDGTNINAGWGATHPERLAGMARGRIGLTFDGDADRLIT